MQRLAEACNLIHSNVMIFVAHREIQAEGSKDEREEGFNFYGKSPEKGEQRSSGQTGG
jgi:hypothetical protein